MQKCHLNSRERRNYLLNQNSSLKQKICMYSTGVFTPLYAMGPLCSSTEKKISQKQHNFTYTFWWTIFTSELFMILYFSALFLNYLNTCNQINWDIEKWYRQHLKILETYVNIYCNKTHATHRRQCTNRQIIKNWLKGSIKN